MSELSKFVASRGFTATVKLDSSGRKGKSVTVIGGLPKNKLFLEAMAKALKARCGSGGTYDMDGRDGVVEIWANGRFIARARGKIGVDGAGGPMQYLKLGHNRAPLPGTATIYYDRFRRGAARAEVER